MGRPDFMTRGHAKAASRPVDARAQHAWLMDQSFSFATPEHFPPKACPGLDPGWAPVRRRKCDKRIESRAHPRFVPSEIDSKSPGCALVEDRPSAHGHAR